MRKSKNGEGAIFPDAAMLDHFIAELHTKGTVQFAVRAMPGAAKTECMAILEDESVKIRIAAPAERGKANQALVKFLAEAFAVRRDQVSVVTGATGRHKLVRITLG